MRLCPLPVLAVAVLAAYAGSAIAAPAQDTEQPPTTGTMYNGNNTAPLITAEPPAKPAPQQSASAARGNANSQAGATGTGTGGTSGGEEQGGEH